MQPVGRGIDIGLGNPYSRLPSLTIPVLLISVHVWDCNLVCGNLDCIMLGL